MFVTDGYERLRTATNIYDVRNEQPPGTRPCPGYPNVNAKDRYAGRCHGYPGIGNLAYRNGRNEYPRGLEKGQRTGT